MRCADVGRPLVLEGFNFGALSDPAGKDGAARGGGLFFSEHGFGDGDHAHAATSQFFTISVRSISSGVWPWA